MLAGIRRRGATGPPARSRMEGEPRGSDRSRPPFRPGPVFELPSSPEGRQFEDRPWGHRLAREIPRGGLTARRAAVAAEVELAPDATLLDVGAGTGAFSSAFTGWFGVRVLAAGQPVQSGA
ncbi:hypothetical protein ABZ695_12990 [Streptomyces sp. NPDC006976]|uniref:hypothetical protein n=1 Tax=Streptomyces sp. NPDC006976 TaxID=3154311 RepID=UPI0033FD38F3